MKDGVRQTLHKPAYNVEEFYHREGVFQNIARHWLFERTTLTVIALNALWIWIDTDWNDAIVFTEAAAHFQIVEHFFCVYFAFEWTVRFLAFKEKRASLRDP